MDWSEFNKWINSGLNAPYFENYNESQKLDS